MDHSILVIRPDILHEGEGWSKGTTHKLYLNVKGYNVLEVKAPDGFKQIRWRRVELNDDAAIQFECKEVMGRRTKLSSFSLPASMAEAFISSLRVVTSVQIKKSY